MGLEKEYNFDEEFQPPILDMGEIYRQNYLDALDEIRNLRQENADLKAMVHYFTLMTKGKYCKNED